MPTDLNSIRPVPRFSTVAGSELRIVNESDASGESVWGHDWVCSGDRWCGHIPSLQQSARLESTPGEVHCTPATRLTSIASVSEIVTRNRFNIYFFNSTTGAGV